MSNGDPPPVSGSSYIIICNVRIAVAAAKDEIKKILAASQGAADLCSFIQSSYDNFDPADCQAISVLQHQLMDHVTGKVKLNHEAVELKIQQLFTEFDGLEGKY